MKRNRKLSVYLSVSAAFFLLIPIVLGIYLYSSRIFESTVRNQNNAAAINYDWMVLKNSMLFDIEEEMIRPETYQKLFDLDGKLMRMLSQKELTPLTRNNQALEDQLRIIEEEWKTIYSLIIKFSSGTLIFREAATQEFRNLSAFLNADEVNSFEAALVFIKGFIDSYSEAQRKAFQIQYYGMVIFLIFFMIFMISISITSHHQKDSEKNMRNLTRILLQVQEDERKQIAYDLHDDIVQDMASIKMKCDNLLDSKIMDPEKVRGDLQKISETLTQLIRTTRDISHNLRPHNLDLFGLVGGLRELCSEFSLQTGIPVAFSSVGMDAVLTDYIITINLYRIVQESLNNIRKHSRATESTVRIIASSPHILLTISDNGTGFFAEKILGEKNNRNRLGLTGIIERTGLLKGETRIISQPGKGTEIKIRVPAKSADE